MRPILVVNPRSDTTFLEFAEAALRDGVSCAEFEVALRTAYPQASVRARELSAEPMVVWYVYRDGLWVSVQ